MCRLVVPAGGNKGATAPKSQKFGQKQNVLDNDRESFGKTNFLCTNKLLPQKKISKCRKIIKI